jgi:hypothetical protein
MVFEPRRFDLDVARTGGDCQRLFVARNASKAFTNMVKTVAIGGEIHNSFAGSVAHPRRI